VNNEDYIRRETVTGVVPMLTSERQYSFSDLFLTTSGFAIATWCYTQGAYVAQFLGFKQMLINIFCVNIIWILIECIPVLFAVHYGIDLWIWLRAVLGSRGVAVLSTTISLANFGWYAVSAGLFASSMIQLAALFGIVLNPEIWKPVLGTACVVIGTYIALGGPDMIRRVGRLMVMALLLVGLIVVGLCVTAVPLTELVQVKPLDPGDADALTRFMMSAEGNVAFAFSWSTQALVLPRLAKSERSGYWATALSYGIVAPFFVAAGGVMAMAMFVASGTYESDPTTILAALSGPGAALLSLLLVAFANIGTQGTGSYVNCMIVKSGMPAISYRLLVFISMVYVSILTIWGGVEENFGAFISLAAYIQGPIIGITVVDYLFLRGSKFSLPDAYYMEGHNAYRYKWGINFKGIICVIVAFAVSMVFVYNPFNGIIHSDIFYVTTGSGFTAICGALLYVLFTKLGF